MPDARSLPHMATKTKTYGQTIRALREQRGWTQDEVAEATDVKVGTVNRWENDKVEIPVRRLLQLQDIFELDEEDDPFGIRRNRTRPRKPPPPWALEMEQRIEERARQRHEELMKALSDITKQLKA